MQLIYNYAKKEASPKFDGRRKTQAMLKVGNQRVLLMGILIIPKPIY
ncbi:hypothetical protein [Hippea alviniae]|nr:hypothetical protein [Hippea alviniae]